MKVGEQQRFTDCPLPAVWRVLETVKVGEQQRFTDCPFSCMEGAGNSEGGGTATVH